MLGEDGPETITQKAMLDAGEASADNAKPLGHNGMFADHDAPPAANYAWAGSAASSRMPPGPVLLTLLFHETIIIIGGQLLL